MMSKFIGWLEALRPISSVALLLNLFLALASSWLVFAKYSSLPAAIPIWFSRDWGEARLGSPAWLWLIPASAGVVLLINNIFAAVIRKNQVLATLLVWFGTFFSLIALYSLYRLVVLAS